jgi:histone acetyltransferase (RNA polymerase elongator complex component)
LKHANVAIFVPNNGCPHMCSFCSQRSITGKAVQPSAKDVSAAAETALRSLGSEAPNAEIAFFGGSFTAIERSYMLSLLQAAEPYIRSGAFRGIRLSTRPDAINDEILSLLKQYGVTTIELGAQSMDNEVLRANQRGHTAEQVVAASKLIHSYGFSLGLQMMTGLRGDTDEKSKKTAEQFADLAPDCVRIYPTIVLRGTELGEAYRKGDYQPQSLESAVELCAYLLDYFEEKNIPVIRLGLHATPELKRDMLAGPWHPAFRELCESRRFLNKIKAGLQGQNIQKGKISIAVNPACISQAVGQKKENLHQLEKLGYSVRIVPDVSVKRGCFKFI